MRDPLKHLGALAHTRAALAPSAEQQAEGRERIMQHAREALPARRTAWRRPAVFAAVAAAAGVLLFIGLMRQRPLGFQVLGSSEQASSYLSAPLDKPADVRFTDGSEIHAEAGTRLRIDETSSNGARVLVERGAATASVKHADTSNWRFVAGPFEVHVTGTKLTLSWDPTKEEVDLVLHEGSVEVESPLARGHFAVRAGQRFHASLLDGSMRVASVATFGSDKAEPPASAAASAHEEPRSLASSEPPAGVHASEPKVNQHARSSVNTAPAADAVRESWPDLVRRGQFKAVVSAAESRGIDGCLASCSASDVRALADAARYSGQSALAEQSLLALRRRFSGTSDGSAAAFLLGRISESRQKLSAADGWYDTYLRETPRGQFASDALAGRMRTVAALRGNAAAKPLALEYLRSYPEGVHAPAAKKLGGFD